MAMEAPLGDDKGEKSEWLLGLDFGTTYSAAAICYRGKENLHCPPGDIKHVDLYPPDTHGSNYRKYREVPSDLRYEQLIVRWGYGVSAALKELRVIPGHRITRFKLLLDESASTLGLRGDVQKTLLDLPGNKTGEQVISDYLAELLGHIQWYMMKYLGYKAGDPIELACTVPAIWSQSASRRMVAAIEDAEKRANFGSVTGDKELLYLVPEPEAAASHVLTQHRNLRLQRGDTFVVCDAGGGTVDLITYTVKNTDPWRMTEAVEGEGAPCGSSFLNEGFRNLLWKRLRNEIYLDEDDGESLEEKIDAAVLEFEKEIKPGFGAHKEEFCGRKVSMPGLKRDDRQDFIKHAVNITSAHLVEIFDPVVAKVWDLIWSQIKAARAQSLFPKLIVLVGGFAGSPFLEDHIKHMCVTDAGGIEVVVPSHPEFAIASGAIVWALNKENAPTRMSRSSVGISEYRPYDTKKYPQLKGLERRYDAIDGKFYVRNCMDWLIKKGNILPPNGPPVIRKFHRTISVEEESCFLTTRVYVLDRVARDGYPIDHSENEGCEFSLEICFEFTAEQLAHLKRELPRHTKKARSQRKVSQKINQIPGQQLRRSPRNLAKPNGKKGTAQDNRLDPDNLVVLEGLLEEQHRPQVELADKNEDIVQLRTFQATQSNYIADMIDAQTTQLSELALESGTQQQQFTDERPSEYIIIDYKLIMEIKGGRTDYRIECTAGGVTHRAKETFNLAKIFAPGTIGA